jgi:hypothetical protein
MLYLELLTGMEFCTLVMELEFSETGLVNCNKIFIIISIIIDPQKKKTEHGESKPTKN